MSVRYSDCFFCGGAVHERRVSMEEIKTYCLLPVALST